MARLNGHSRNPGRLAGTVLEFLDTLGDISDNAREMIENAGVGNLPVYWNSRLRSTAGRCLYSRRDGRVVAVKLDLNPALRVEGADALRNTFLHEAAHAVAGKAAGHGLRWQRTHRALGGTAERCHDYESMPAQRRQRRVVAECDKCGVEIQRARRLPQGRTYTHTGCGGRIVSR